MRDFPGVQVEPQSEESLLASLQSDIRDNLQLAIASGTDESLAALFKRLNDFAWTWLNEKPRKLVSQEMSCLFSAASALITRRLHFDTDGGFLSTLVDILESSQQRNDNYGMKGFDTLPLARLQITATGGERGCRTLYVTIATGLICSTYRPTVVQGNYSVTGCNCGAFAESDIMEHFEYLLGSSENDITRLKKDNFAYLHVQRYQPILKVFCTERGALGFRDMMKLAVVLGDPFRCECQYIGVWDKNFMLPMARALIARKYVKSGAIVASDHLDEFTDSAVVTIGGQVKEINDMSKAKVAQGTALQSATPPHGVKEECATLRGFFEQNWSQPDSKLELVLQNTALALAVCEGTEFFAVPIQRVSFWRDRLLKEQTRIKSRCLQVIDGWKS